jgi:hypothetical protein
MSSSPIVALLPHGPVTSVAPAVERVQSMVDRVLDHRQGQLRLGREVDRLRNTGRSTPTPVGAPGRGQIQPGVDQRAARPGTRRVTNTPSWLFSTRPAVPEYCRCTPTDMIPYDERVVMPHRRRWPLVGSSLGVRAGPAPTHADRHRPRGDPTTRYAAAAASGPG